MKKVYLIATLFVSVSALAQKDNVGIGTNKPDQSAALEISSINKGLLTPRMSLQQRNTIQNPATGLIVYQTDLLSGFYYYDGKEWKSMTSETGAKSVADAFNWGLTGNSGTNSATNFIGTTDAQPLIFKTGGTAATNQRMVIDASGIMGLGFNSSNLPVYQLIASDVSGTSQLRYKATRYGSDVRFTRDSPSGEVLALSFSGTQGGDNSFRVFSLDGSYDAVRVSVGLPTYFNGGNVLVGKFGAQDTGEKLQIEGTSSLNGIVKIGNVPANVSGYKLFVEGGVMTEKIKVALSSDPSNWADYVFEEDYKVLPLQEVEAYTKKYKHLPNVPSTEELLSSGLDIAKISAKLMEKIEELTIYIIDINKKVEALKEENLELRKNIRDCFLNCVK